MQLINSSIFGFLLRDVLTDGVLISTNCRYELASGPKTLAGEILLASKELSCNVNRALALDETDHLGNAVFGWNGDLHVNVIQHEVAFFDPTLFLVGQVSKHLAKMCSQLSIKAFSSALWYPNDMILALPDRVA
jgi:hypothetical protein